MIGLSKYSKQDLQFILERKQPALAELSQINDSLPNADNVTQAQTINRSHIAAAEGIVVSSTVIDIFSTIFYFVTFNTSTVVILASISGCLALSLGFGAIMYRLKEMIKEEKKIEADIAVVLAKQQAVTELYQKQQKSLLKRAQLFLTYILEIAEQKNKVNEIKNEIISWKIDQQSATKNSQQASLDFATSSEKQQELLDIITDQRTSTVYSEKKSKKFEYKRSLPVTNNTTNNNTLLFSQILKTGNKTNAVTAAITFTSVLFASYYWGGTALLTALKATATVAILSSPPATAIVLGIALSLGLYVGYHYLARAATLKATQKQLTEAEATLNTNMIEYSKLENARNNLDRMLDRVITLKSVHQLISPQLSRRMSGNMNRKVDIASFLSQNQKQITFIAAPPSSTFPVRETPAQSPFASQNIRLFPSSLRI